MLSRFSFVSSVMMVAASTATYAGTLTFDSPVSTGSSQAAGVWYTDRYAPAGFQGGVSFGGDNRLQQSIAASDGAASRPGAYSTAFYNTQGRKYDLDAGTVFASIDLYVPVEWASTGRRMAGFWGTAFDAGNVASAYPIIEFTSDGASPRFRAWDLNGGWNDLGLPSGFSYESWSTLQVTMLPDGSFKYQVGNLSWTTGVTASTSIGNTILQGHNTASGVNYDIYWDNLTTSNTAAVVPLPAAAWMGMALMSSVGGVSFLRKRARVA